MKIRVKKKKEKKNFMILIRDPSASHTPISIKN